VGSDGPELAASVDPAHGEPGAENGGSVDEICSTSLEERPSLRQAMLFLEHLMPSSLFLEKASRSSFPASRGRYELLPGCTKNKFIIEVSANGRIREVIFPSFGATTV